MKPLKSLITKNNLNNYIDFDSFRGDVDSILVIIEENGKDIDFLKKQRYSHWFMIGDYDCFIIPHENLEELVFSGKNKSIFRNTRYTVYDFPYDRFKTLHDFFKWVDNTSVIQIFNELEDYYQFSDL